MRDLTDLTDLTDRPGVDQIMTTYSWTGAALLCQHPDMTRPRLGLGPLPEVRVHAQIVADTVLPPVIVRTKVWEIFTGKSNF